MNPSSTRGDKGASASPSIKEMWLVAALFVLTSLALFSFFSRGLAPMVEAWNSPDYSHGWLIPFIALYLAWQVRYPLLQVLEPMQGQRAYDAAWLGLPLLLFGLFLGWMGELATLATLVEYGFVFSIWALVWLSVGWRGAKLLWPALLCLFFMVPLPNLFHQNLSQILQLWSSDLGVFFLRLMGVTVHLSGNVIDLGPYQLQVAEACSGLRYLFPLVSFCYLVACFYRRSWWLKTLLILSALPITLLMNSIRIALIGLSVEYWGIEMAEGILHSFEGWVVFIGCLLFLAAEVTLVERFLFRNPKPWQRIDLQPKTGEVSGAFSAYFKPVVWPLLVSSLILFIGLSSKWASLEREEYVPERPTFSSFPLLHQGWLGRESGFTDEIVEQLKVSDYFNADYERVEGGGMPISLYIAWYDSQRLGTAIHSPQTCLPADGWEIQSMEKVNLYDFLGFNPPSERQGGDVSRVIIQKGLSRQLVYYWFSQRGRVFSDQYLAKWYLFQDSLALNRTDGSLIRVVTPILETEKEEDADQRLRHFLKDFYGIWDQWIPGYDQQ